MEYGTLERMSTVAFTHSVLKLKINYDVKEKLQSLNAYRQNEGLEQNISSD